MFENVSHQVKDNKGACKCKAIDEATGELCKNIEVAHSKTVENNKDANTADTMDDSCKKMKAAHSKTINGNGNKNTTYNTEVS